MMRKPMFLAVLFVSLSVSICCVSSTPQPYMESSSIDQLLIDKSHFPEGWTASDPNTDSPSLAPWTSNRREVEYIDRTYYAPSNGGRAFIRIQRLSNYETASEEYDQKTNIAFRETEYNTRWTVPGDLTFESTLADQYQYACSIEGVEELSRPKCVYIAQYRMYILEFYIDLYDTEVITYTDLLPIFQAIEEQMEQHLNAE